MAGALVASRSQPTGVPPLETLVIEAVESGGGNNVVNVILTDIRGSTRSGEIVVLAVVAIGMLALARPEQSVRYRMIAPRSPIVCLGVGVVGPLAVLVALYLFFAGHNQPGGGFAAGLVLGALVALRASPAPRAR